MPATPLKYKIGLKHCIHPLFYSDQSPCPCCWDAVWLSPAGLLHTSNHSTLNIWLTECCWGARLSPITAKDLWSSFGLTVSSPCSSPVTQFVTSKKRGGDFKLVPFNRYSGHYAIRTQEMVLEYIMPLTWSTPQYKMCTRGPLRENRTVQFDTWTEIMFTSQKETHDHNLDCYSKLLLFYPTYNLFRVWWHVFSLEQHERLL